MEGGRTIECYEAPSAGDKSGMIRRDIHWLSWKRLRFLRLGLKTIGMVVETCVVEEVRNERRMRCQK